MNLIIEKYNSSWEQKWDDFVLRDSINGTFLQTRNFLNYHPKSRFEDASILIRNGTNIVAVVPANTGSMEGKKAFFSHMGSTFGGLILGYTAYNVSYLETIMPLLDEYYSSEGYEYVAMKSTSDLFSQDQMALLDYEYFRFGYDQYNEIAFFLRCEELPEDGLSMMSSSRRRDCRYSLKNGFRIERLSSDEQILRFYEILEENLKKFDAKPVHTCEELLDFKNSRLVETVKFYGVFEEDRLIAGAMLFAFGKRVLHTQYLACLPEYTRKYAMNFLDYNLIKIARQEGFEYFSFGTSTGNHGKELNVGLALYKEGFGCRFSNNRTYFKNITRNK